MLEEPQALVNGALWSSIVFYPSPLFREVDMLWTECSISDYYDILGLNVSGQI